MPSLGIYNESGGSSVAVAAQRGGFVGESIQCFDAEDGLAGHMLYFFRRGRLRKLSGTSLSGKSRGRPELGSCVGECPPQFEYID